MISIGNRMDESVICIGNRMDESAIWEKIARQQKNCTCYLNCFKSKFFQKLHSGPWDYLLIVMTYLH